MYHSLSMRGKSFQVCLAISQAQHALPMGQWKLYDCLQLPIMIAHRKSCLPAKGVPVSTVPLMTCTLGKY